MRRFNIPPFIWVISALSLIYLLIKIYENHDNFPIIDHTKIEQEAYSTGDKILIHQRPYYKGENYDKEDCTNNWTFKENLDFQKFLEKCPEDVESQIYLNNKKAYSQADNSKDNIIAQIAIVVPISGKKIESYNSEEKVNGTRVFDSLELLKGIEIAQREINIESEGIQLGSNRIFLEVVIVDDSYVDTIDVKEKAQRVANYLAENQDTLAVIGHFSSDSIQAAAGIYKNKLVAFSPTSTGERKNNKRLFSILKDSKKLKLNSYIFRTSPNDSIAIDRLIKVINLENQVNPDSIKNVVILYEPENNFSRLYRKGFKKQFLNDIKNTEVFEDVDFLSCQFYPNTIGNNQYRHCVNFIKNRKPDALLLVPSSAKAIDIAATVLHTIKDFEYKPQLLGADTMFNQLFLSEIAEGMIVIAPLKTRIFKEIQLSWRGAMTYDATKAIIKGIEDSECNSNSSGINDCLRKQIRSVLSNKDFKADGILGRKSVFFKNGDREVSDALSSELAAPLQVKKIKDDKYTFELY